MNFLVLPPPSPPTEESPEEPFQEAVKEEEPSQPLAEASQAEQVSSWAEPAAALTSGTAVSEEEPAAE